MSTPTPPHLEPPPKKNSGKMCPANDHLKLQPFPSTSPIPKRTTHHPRDQPANPPSELRLVSHNLQKRYNFATQTVFHLHNQVDIVAFQESTHTITAPLGFETAKIFQNISRTTRRGTSLISSPRIAPLASELIKDPRGLITSALLRLPGSNPILILSIYTPRHDDKAGTYIVQLISPLLSKFPQHILLGDFNALVNHTLDSDGVTSPNSWPWLNTMLCFAHSSPQLLDSLCLRHPHSREFTRFPSALHANQSRIDLILISPLLNSHFPLISASFDSNNCFSDHHPFSSIISTPPLPTTTRPTRPQSVFRKLTKEELNVFRRSISDLDHWVHDALPHFNSLSTPDHHIYHRQCPKSSQNSPITSRQPLKNSSANC